MISQEELQRREEEQLSPWATRSSTSRGRLWPEEPDPFRTCFLRDRDRLLHSNALRRLQHKTQVLCVAQGDHYRTRLTHTLEVYQMSQSAAVALGLNSELAQAVALAHDLGHPPFGHAGEQALARLMAAEGGFSHNAQAARLVDHLESRSSSYPGLNLSFETRRSLVKRRPPACFPLAPDLEEDLDNPPPLEAMVVDLADGAAYLHHDLDDALRTGLVAREDLEEITLWRQARQDLEAQGKGADGLGMVVQTLARMIKLTNQDLIRQADKQMSTATGKFKPGHSPAVEKMLTELQAFLDDHFYRHPKVKQVMNRGAALLEDLFHRFTGSPDEMPPLFQGVIPRWGVKRAACDYLAGMTDRFVWTLAGEEPESLRL